MLLIIFVHSNPPPASLKGDYEFLSVLQPPFYSAVFTRVGPAVLAVWRYAGLIADSATC